MKTQHPVRSSVPGLRGICPVAIMTGAIVKPSRVPAPGRMRNSWSRSGSSIRTVVRPTAAPAFKCTCARAGRPHGRNRIARLMRQQGLCGRAKGRFRVHTTDSNHDQPIAPNRLADLPAPSAPNQIWVADITYIPTAEGWLYLAAIMDLYSRRIVGWAMDQTIDTDWSLRLEHGVDSSPARSRADLPLRPRLPIRQC